MTVSPPGTYFIGWDVGGWNCDTNHKSRDAIVILDHSLTIVGKPWRGNLREYIVAASTTNDWLRALFSKCETECAGGSLTVTMGIDTPLGFPEALVGLITHTGTVEPDPISSLNRYLFRYTERHLFERGLSPLSSVKDRIGSQATKGMHVLAKFATNIESCGVWTDSSGFRVIETYPTAVRKSPTATVLAANASLGHGDLDDAYVCALVAAIFSTDPRALESPPDDVPRSEGWIWAPPLPKSTRTGANS